MSAQAAVTLRRQGAPDLLVAYADAVAVLPIGPDGRRIRRNAAGRLLAVHPQLAAWMRRPTPARLADVDMGLRRVRVTGKGGKERVVPVDAAFFAELAAYLREERPASCRTAECFVVLRGPTAGQPLTEAGLRRIFRIHRLASGAVRVRPHRLRHTYGTELASAGIDLLALRELMGHANPETTAAYVHLSPEALAAEYARAKAAAR